MITFGIMKVEGFCSIQKLEMDWSGSHGVILIQARNGSGKSRIINAFYWALFGKSLYGSVETWDHLKPKDYKGTKVDLQVFIDKKEYNITRCLNYTGKVNGFSGKNRLIIIEDGKEWNIKDKRNIQDEWIKVLGYTSILFNNSILFGQKQKRMMDNKSSEKKELFDEAFDTLVLGKAYNLASEKSKEVLGRTSKIESEISSLKLQILGIEGLIEKQDKLAKEFEDNKNDRINSIKSQIKSLKNSQDSSLKKEIEQLERTLSEGLLPLSIKEEAEEHIKLCNRLREQYESEKREIESEIFHFTRETSRIEKELNNIHDTCPTCRRPFDPGDIEKLKDTLNNKIKKSKFRTEELYKKLSKTQSHINDQIEGYSMHQKHIEKYNRALEKKKKLEDKLTNLRFQLKAHNKITDTIGSMRVEIKKIKNQTFKRVDYEKEVDSLKANIKIKKRSLIKDRLRVRRLKFAQNLFSNKGIKSWLFSILLEKVNDKLKDYESISGFDINFWVDMESTKGDIYSLVKFYGEEVPYEDLSGGQQQLVNLLSIFAIMDVIQEKKPCPLFIGDELFESLDKGNIQIVTNIIRQKSSERRMFIVTHLSDFILENAKILQLENRNGQTVLL